MTQREEEIGNVSFMLGQLKQGMDAIIKTLSEDRQAAAQYRTDIRSEMSGLRAEYHDVRSDLNVVKEKVEKMEPKVDSMEQKHDQEDGAKSFAISVGSFLGKFIQLLVGAIGGVLAVLAERWFRGH